jgi:pimeloyl-ACP methyl ester carboxylesterase
VFLHALLPAANGRSIEPAALDLTDRLSVRVVGIDAPGFGDSPPLPDDAYDLDRLAALLGDSAGDVAGSPYVLAGHSWGAALAVRIAAARPSEVRGVVLLDGGHFDHAALPDADPDQTVDDTLAEMEGMDWRAGQPVQRAAAAAMNHLMRSRTSEHYPRLASAGLPVLLLTATEPEQRRVDNLARTARLQAALPRVRAHAVPGSGHDLVRDAPDQVAALIAGWWSEELGLSRLRDR